jgi:hypothetical protein
MPVFAVRSVRARWLVVVVYAVAMAYVESAAVLYLRTIIGGVDPVGVRYTPFNPIPDFGWIEIGREAATMVMLATVGWLAGRGVAGRVGAFAIAMGVWDIFYYVFLWVFVGWPASPLAPDVLFLIPLPWWGPVLSPVLLALLMVAGGTGAMAREAGDGLPPPPPQAWLLVLGGGLLCLAAFMADALVALPRGIEAAFSVRGGPFPWALYSLGLALAAVGLVQALWRVAAELPELPPRAAYGGGLRGRLTRALELFDLGG